MIFCLKNSRSLMWEVYVKYYENSTRRSRQNLHAKISGKFAQGFVHGRTFLSKIPREFCKKINKHFLWKYYKNFCAKFYWIFRKMLKDFYPKKQKKITAKWTDYLCFVKLIYLQPDGVNLISVLTSDYFLAKFNIQHQVIKEI